MRSTLVLLSFLASTATALALVPAVPATAADDRGPDRDRATVALPPVQRSAPVSLPEQASPRATLEAAGRVLDGEARTADPSATVALRDLWLARPDLTGAEAVEAEALLSRPTDGAKDPFDNGYTVPSTRTCGEHVCVHHVPSTADAPPSADWVDLTLATLENTYAVEVDQLGYRAPLGDRRLGGDDRLDVYLKDLGTGLYGYCAAEYRKKGRTASGFCVLDNDYAPAQFPSGTSPQDNLTVTAAHEFFHAVQYAYDYAEDPWMMESTATWVEERVADHIDDNRQYLRYSQLQAPFVPLDAFSSTYGFQYGNWIFWEYLTQQYSQGLVKKAWRAAGSLKKDGRRYSVQAVQSVLRKKGGLAKVYADFAAANTVPGLVYEEGAAYGVATPADAATLTRAARSWKKAVRLDHLAGDSVRLAPGADLSGGRWRLEVRVDGPSRSASPAATAVVHKLDGTAKTMRVRLDRRGKGVSTVPFNAATVAAVTVSVANVSTRYRCGRKTSLACAGESRDDDRKFTVHTTAVKKQKRGR
ncbi:MXAN_6640 family putative metalloprotease [Nocardioides sp. Soil777]|uniref:MXAN_6640 family putative metalloprotease n=1 Tax=Nocardioides sp. Soil777 TaxID=1736409 RepID=UPI0012FAF9FB|nr:MXAN_6640 family putative metalloprotease [Nocardioides sp. Soil777]